MSTNTVEQATENIPEPEAVQEGPSKRERAVLECADKVIDQRHRVKERETEYNAKKEAAKEAKEDLEMELSILNSLVDEMDAIKDGRALQGALPFADETEDVHGKASIEVLALPDGMIEKLIEAEIKTIEDLEKRIAAGDLVPAAIKGIGQTAVDKITDALVKYRGEHPIPVPDEASEETDPEANKEEDPDYDPAADACKD